MSRPSRRPGLVASGAPAAHDLNRTAVFTILDQRFLADALDRACTADVGGWTDRPLDSIEQAVDVLAGAYDASRSMTSHSRAWLCTADGLTVWVRVDEDGEWRLGVTGGSQSEVDAEMARFAAAFPPAAADPGDAVNVRFWAMGTMGPFSYFRKLDVAAWAAVEDNYPAAVGGQLADLMTMTAPEEGAGRLMLWNGPPGTGKTHCLRALADAWRDWCSVDYVVDADQFFGYAAYMVSALVDGCGDAGWRLVVIEDAGEFLCPTAADKVGQGLSRLLNLGDGLVGQGLKLLVLLTTNEPVDELHPAVVRPGRCLSQIEFGKFEPVEASRWLAAHGRPPGVDVLAPMTLAEMYARPPAARP